MLQGFYKNQIHTPKTQTYLCSQLWFLIHVLEWKPFKEEYFKSQIQGSQTKSGQVELNEYVTTVVLSILAGQKQPVIPDNPLRWVRDPVVEWFEHPHQSLQLRSCLVNRVKFNLIELWPLIERNHNFTANFRKSWIDLLFRKYCILIVAVSVYP